MNTFPITGPRRRFAIMSLASVATMIVIAGALALTFAPMLVKAQSGSAFVRVNQVGYAATASKRAYLMASGAEAGATFSVKNASGATVYSAPIGANLGSWSNSYPDVYALDFDSVTTPGTYTIVTSGPIVGSSPGFTIGTAANEYTGALSNTLSFYQNERDGPNYIPSALRTAPGHLNDASAMTYLTPNMNSSGRFSGNLSPLGVKIDASGGWWDAGDYLKFVETISYTVDILQLGVRDFPNQMGSGSTFAARSPLA